MGERQQREEEVEIEPQLSAIAAELRAWTTLQTNPLTDWLIVGVIE